MLPMHLQVAAETYAEWIQQQLLLELLRYECDTDRLDASEIEELLDLEENILFTELDTNHP